MPLLKSENNWEIAMDGKIPTMLRNFVKMYMKEPNLCFSF